MLRDVHVYLVKCINFLQCIKDCPIGYYWVKCSRTCPFPYFGKRCDQSCSCKEEFCNFMYGCENGKYFQRKKNVQDRIVNNSFIEKKPKIAC